MFSLAGFLRKNKATPINTIKGNFGRCLKKKHDCYPVTNTQNNTQTKAHLQIKCAHNAQFLNV